LRRRPPHEGPTRSCLCQQSVAHAQAPPLALSCCELEDRLRPPSTRSPPRSEPGNDLEDFEVRVEEDGVDRETHERCVYGRRGTEQDALAARQLAPAEEAPHPRERRVRQATALAHRPSILQRDGELHP